MEEVEQREIVREYYVNAFQQGSEMPKHSPSSIHWVLQNMCLAEVGGTNMPNE